MTARNGMAMLESASTPPIVIRLLGQMVVLRRDRSTVGGHEWRTGKTMDLLRLLALQAGRPVRTQMLIDRLWPRASPERARGSLRTAASQVRRALHDDCIVREPGTMMLRDAWVDVVAVSSLLLAGRSAALVGNAEVVVSRARAMERLYQGDFHAYDDDSDWAVAERDHLLHRRLELLDDAAQSCLIMGRYREALAHAHAVLVVDPTAEGAQRTKMRAHAELGEVGSALRVFERYRRQLADDLGVDPPAQIRDLHLEILRTS